MSTSSTSPPTQPAAEMSTFDSPDTATPHAGDPARRELDELRRQGAKSAMRGETSASNPMLEPVNLPATTGETEQVWSSRSEAWQRGHSLNAAAAVPPARRSAEPIGAAGSRHRDDEALFGVTRILTFLGQQALTSASGFFFERDGRLFLVTSRHVLFDESSHHAPDRIEITVHTDGRDLTRLAVLSILLYRDGRAVWRQAKDSGGAVDMATVEVDRSALPVECVLRAFGPQHLAAGFDDFEVGDRLAIPGFPLGFFDTVHQLPVVRQASIASRFGVRFQGQGYFLTDARMHRGSSGSPVLARLDGPAGESRWCLLGVHSSRMDMATRDLDKDESLGLNCAWYADVLMTLTLAGSDSPSR